MPFQRYIVVFKKTASKGDIQKWKDEITKGSGTITHEYGTVLNGFAAEIPPETFVLLTQNVKDDGPVQYIEPDGVVTTQ